MPVVVIESLDHEGRGIAHDNGKVIFIEGALVGEEVDYASYRKKPKFEQATVARIVRSSGQRAEPACAFFNLCGGCSLQHAEIGSQVAAKQRVLEDALWHLARTRAEIIYPPIYGPTWGYRDRARLSVKAVAKKDGGVLVGFRERKSSYVADMTSCAILPPRVSALLLPLRELIAALSAPDRVAQIELAVGDGRIVLALRNLQPFSAEDVRKILAFGQTHDVCMWQQPGGTDTVMPLDKTEPPFLTYSLPEFGVFLNFRPTDFTQVNVHINRLLMRRAMQLLAPAPGERIADLFCGLGNFSLPIASFGAHVVGVEGSDALVRRAAENAAANGLSGVSEFHEANLFDATEQSLAALGHFDKMLIDPPREGAIAVVRALGVDAPKRIVYVSCNPSTLARDAAVLVGEKGYRLKGAGIANMFPHTSHVESIALFERD